MQDGKAIDPLTNLAQLDRCRRCGASIPAASSDRVCPACLLSGVMSLEGEAETTEMGSGGGRTGGAVGAPAAFVPSSFPCTFGGYRLLSLLGSGGMGAVYEAEHLATGRRVGLKMLNHRLDSSDMRRRFLREGRLAAAVSHPNSLYVFGSEEIEGHPVITMELAAGGTLKDKLDQRGPLPVAEAVDAMLDVIAGLEAAFTGGVLHRDIKPSNCFVNPDGSVKVGDFGLSVSTLGQDSSLVTATGVIMGTPAYAAPEQLRGDELDARADIYSVGATLFTLLTGRAPFDGQNAVQVVANAVNQSPKWVTEFRADVPRELARVVARCLAKEPGQRFPDYAALRSALLPFSSEEPEPASMKVRAAAGWMDFLIAFLTPYVPLMLLAGAEQFHIRPFMEPSMHAFRYYLAWLCFGFVYFGVVEGVWGGGPGKRLKGLRVVTTTGRRPGVGRALMRIVVIMACIEVVRMPVVFALFALAEPGQITGFHVWTYNIASNVCPWIIVLFALDARQANGHAALWDRLSGTRVIVKPEGDARPVLNVKPPAVAAQEPALFSGPFQVLGEIAANHWLAAVDPVLQRRVWLLRRRDGPPAGARQQVARRGRLRWLQRVADAQGVWDAYEARCGMPLSDFLQGDRRVPWSLLRHWLEDLASELLEAGKDGTLPGALSLDHVWIAAPGHAILLDEPWPGVPSRAESMAVGNLAGQQRFLAAVAACVDGPRLPLHARGVLRNLREGRFEKLSFLTGVLRGLLNKPCEVGSWVRAGSIFLLPAYVWTMVVVALPPAAGALGWERGTPAAALIAAGVVLALRGLFRLAELPFRTTCSHGIFRLAVVDPQGGRAGRGRLLRRWAITWLPLYAAGSLVSLLWAGGFAAAAFIAGLVVFGAWMAAAIHTVLHPGQGWHDRLAGTRVVRQ